MMNIISAREHDQREYSRIIDPPRFFFLENYGEAKRKKERKEKIATPSLCDFLLSSERWKREWRRAQGRDRRERTRARCFGATEPGYLRKNARSPCIAPRAAGRRHGRYKWAGQAVVPSGHEEETHGPATLGSGCEEDAHTAARQEDSRWEKAKRVRGEEAREEAGKGAEGRVRPDEEGGDMIGRIRGGREREKERGEEVIVWLGRRKGETGGKMVGVGCVRIGGGSAPR